MPIILFSYFLKATSLLLCEEKGLQELSKQCLVPVTFQVVKRR